MKKWSYSDLKISIKLSVMYVCFLVISLSISLAIYMHISNRITVEKNIDLSMRTLYSLEASIYNLVNNISYNSRIIMANNEIQQIISDEDKVLQVTNQQTISKIMVRLSYSVPYFESIYLFDNYGNTYGADKKGFKAYNFELVKTADWYKKVKEKDGYYILELNANHIFSDNRQENSVALIRIINDTITMKPIGLLMINISQDVFMNNYYEASKEYSPNILLLNEADEIISAKGDMTLDTVKAAFPDGFTEEKGSKVILLGNKKFLCSYIHISEYNWKAVVSIPLQEMEKELYQVLFIMISVFSGIFLLICFLIMSKTITNPINKLVHSMKQLETGRFVKVDMKLGNDEIGKLKDNYNIMVDEIEKLIHKIYQEQKFKRKAELRVLQEQVKPHFLYNTIDAMRYLAYSEQYKELCEALEAFGSYYRTSLSKGREIISVKKEIEIVRDYLYLQKMRYGEILQTVFEIDEKVLGYDVPKLILQPLVENAIYHGIKPKMEKGTIYIRAFLKDDMVVFEVEDDGLGMSQEELLNLKTEKLEKNMKSFGLRGTCERLSIYYERADLYCIESEKNVGTKITFKIPIGIRGKENDQTNYSR